MSQEEWLKRQTPHLKLMSLSVCFYYPRFWDKKMGDTFPTGSLPSAVLLGFSETC